MTGGVETYNAFKQAIDVSAIPVAAIDRMEISADGSSAIYGSDAVAGVVNIILKKDFDGLNVAGRWGASTDGGNKQQQYGVVAGRKWSSGGVLLAYDFEHDTPILARQRSYAANSAPGLTLYPEMERHNVVFAGHQEILAGLTLTVDGIYNRRYGNYSYALTSLGNPTVDGAYNHSTSTSFSIAPALTLALPHDWEMSLSGAVGQDKTRYGSTTYVAGNPGASTLGCYCNRSQSVEVSTDGPLVSVPAGKVKIAAGAGYRANDFHGYRTLGTPQNIKVMQDSYYAYGELNIPLVSPDQNIPFVNHMNLGLAARYEAYPDIDDVFTPKVSVIFAPSPDVDFRGSWGKSFRTPTLYQRFTPSSVSLVNAASRGGIGLPGTATVLTLTGGSTDLKPERATTWSATVAIHPEAVPAARLDVSYFDVSYRDRIVAPVVVAQGLSNPIYADFVTRNPTAAEQAALIAGATNFVNGTGRAYDPGNVVAIIFNANVNAAEQKAHGVDILAQYRLDLGGSDTVRFDLNGSVLTSRQKLSELQPSIPLAGRIFNPARFRGRGGVTWTHADLTVTAFANYTSALDDARATTIIPVSSMTTVDVAARYRVQSTGLLDGLVMSLSVLNLFNSNPSLLQTTQVYEAPYESTNFSPVGRFISFGLSKQW